MPDKAQIVLAIEKNLDLIEDAVQKVGGEVTGLKSRNRMNVISASHVFPMGNVEAAAYQVELNNAVFHTITELFEANSWRTKFVEAMAEGVLAGNNSGGGGSIVGNQGRIPKFSTSSSLDDSIMLQQGSVIYVDGDVQVGAGVLSAVVAINGGVGQTRALKFQSGSLDRWALITNSAAEETVNVGSDFELAAYTDAGVLIDNPIKVVRAAAGLMTLTRPARLTALAGTGVRFVTVDAVGNLGSATDTGGVLGTGTIGKIPKWTGTGTLGDSILTEASTVITVAGDISFAAGNGIFSTITSPRGMITRSSTELVVGDSSGWTNAYYRVNSGAHKLQINGTDYWVVTTTGLAASALAGTGVRFVTVDASGNFNTTPSAGSSYTDEEAQDAVGNILVDSSTIDFTYSDPTPSITASIITNSVGLTHMAQIITASFLGRNTAATGNVEVLTIATAKAMLGLTGTNSGDQTITLSGDVSGTGTGAITTVIGANKVTIAMMAQVATQVFLGRNTAATGNVEVLTIATAKAMLGLTGTNSGDQTITLSGDVSGTGTGAITTVIGANKVTIPMMAQIITASFLGRNTAATGNVEVLTIATAKAMLNLSGTNTGDQTITLSGDVSGTGIGAITTVIGANKVLNTMIRQSVGLSVIGRSANTTGDVADIVGTNGQILRISGTTLGFGSIVATQVERANLVQASANRVILTGSGTGVLLGSVNVTLDLPQDIHTSANPTFALGTFTSGLRISGGAGSGTYTARGEIYSNATDGLVVIGRVGSSTDLVLASGTGSTIMQTATGTVNTTFFGQMFVRSTNGIAGNLTDRGGLIVGTSAGLQLQVDLNGIQVMNGTTPAKLLLQYHGAANIVMFGATGATGLVMVGEDATALGRFDIRTTAAAGVSLALGVRSTVNSTWPGYTYFSEANTINFGYNINAVEEGWVNYRGYQNGTTQFRDFRVGDGKQNTFAYFKGSQASLIINNGVTSDGVGKLQVNGAVWSNNGFYNNTTYRAAYYAVEASGTAYFQANDGATINVRFAPSGHAKPHNYFQRNTIFGEDFAPIGKIDVRATSAGGISGAFGDTGSAQTGCVYISAGNAINAMYETNANANLWLNYNGFSDGTTQFRDLIVGDGKRNRIVMVDGSLQAVGINCDPASGVALDVLGSTRIVGSLQVTTDAFINGMGIVNGNFHVDPVIGSENRRTLSIMNNYDTLFNRKHVLRERLGINCPDIDTSDPTSILAALHVFPDAGGEAAIAYETSAVPDEAYSHGLLCKTYFASGKFVIQWKESDGFRYKWIDLAGTTTTWQQSTSPPA